MHIVFFSHYFPPEGNAPATRVHALAKRWVQRGHQVTVVTCVPNVPTGVVYEGYCNRILPQHEKVDYVEVTRVWTYIAANKGSIRRILNFLSYMVTATWFGLFVRCPDVIVATSPQFLCGWAGVLLHWFRRVPFVLEIRDIWPESIVAVGAGLPPQIIRILEWLEKRMYAAADHIVTVGDGYKERLLEKGASSDRISVVMNGVDPGAFSDRAPNPTLLEKYHLDGKFVCSYVGTIGMACGLDVVLRAARVLRDDPVGGKIVFLLVGDGANRGALEAEARRDWLENVVFTGRIDKALVPDVLVLSDVCLVHLRKTELFTSVMPSKIFEAAGMARPIINGVRGFAAQFIDQAGAGVNIEPENEAELVEALKCLRADPALRRRLGETGRRYVREQFNRDDQARSYLDILRRVAGQ